MSRLEAKEKALFYPSPPNVIELIASNITPGPGTILDPCCGTGDPLAQLGQRLGLATYGNELHQGRFSQATDQLDFCLSGGREFLAIEGQFSVLFDNPPYDQAISGQRMEMEHIRLDIELLTDGGLGIWIIPETIIDYSFCAELLPSLSNVEIRRFPLPEYRQFKQVVIFGNKLSKPRQFVYSLAAGLEEQVKQGLPVLQANEFLYTYPDTEPTNFSHSFPASSQILAQAQGQGVTTTDGWQALFGTAETGIDNLQPMLKLNSGHTAFVIAAGLVDGTTVEIDGQTHLVKGSTAKEVTETKETQETSGGEKTVVKEREKLVQTISALNLNDGTLLSYNSLADHEGFSDFLLNHQDIFVRAIERNYPPLFQPERDMPDWASTLARIHAPGLLPGQEIANGLLPAQQVRAAAMASKLGNDKAVILSGEMGSGKTACSQAIIALIGKGDWKLVVICPSQVVEKWKREAEKVLRDFGVNVHIIGQKRKQSDGYGKTRKIAKPILDVQRAMAEPNPSILIMSFQTAKNGARWTPAVWKRNMSVTKTVAIKVETPYYPYYELAEQEETTIEPVLCCPACAQILRDEDGKPLVTLGKKKLKCPGCKSPLWQQIPFAYGGRVAIADYLNRHHSGQYSLILDEAHGFKGADTDAGYASTDLIAGAQKVIAMTGTLYGGKASSIFYLLYRLFPFFRRLYNYDEVQRFIEHHGLQETITTATTTDEWSSTYGYTRENKRVREIPGVSPSMVTMLLDNTAFLKLADMGLNLPEYREERLPIPLDTRLQEGLDQIKSLHEDVVKLAMKGDMSLLSQWLYLSLGWLDCPIDDVLKNDDISLTIPGVLTNQNELMKHSLAKDLALVDLVESELGQGRGVGVFFAQVNRRDWMGRIQSLLESRGIYSEILRQNTAKPQDREEWYQGFVKRCQLKDQQPVLLANGNLVKEGLDLIELPTLIETGIEYRINDLRQRDRRSWRITQDKPVKVIFLYYEDTWQETALQLIAAKLKAALMVDGDLAEGLAAMNVDDGNLMDALMKAVSSGQPRKVEWSGMDISSTDDRAKEVKESRQPPVIYRVPVALDAVQLSFFTQ